MQVAWRTPMEKLDQLQKCINNYLQIEENRWFRPSTALTLQKIEYQQYLEITIGIPYNQTWQYVLAPLPLYPTDSDRLPAGTGVCATQRARPSTRW